MPTVKHICISDKQDEQKTSVTSAEFRKDIGIIGDTQATNKHQQVSLLDEQAIHSARIKNPAAIQPGAFAENIILSGIDLTTIGPGTKIQLGNDVLLSITQIGKPHNPHRISPCNIEKITGDCLLSHAGLFARIDQSGQVTAGDTAKIIETIPRNVWQAVVLTISDRCSCGEAIDTSGPAVASRLQESLNAHIYHIEIIPDDKDTIIERLKHYSDGHSIDLIVTTGGTGPAPRDVTPEASRAVIERLTPGFDEAMRYASLTKTPFAMLSRGVSGIRGSTMIINLPGSERGAIENLDATLDALPHALKLMRGHPADCACCRPVLVTDKVLTGAG